MRAARECSVALIGCGRVGRAFLDLVVARRTVVRERTGVHLRVTAVADSSALLLHEPGFTEAHIRYIVAAKAAGTSLLQADLARSTDDLPDGPSGPSHVEFGAITGLAEAWSVNGIAAADSLLAAHQSGAPDVVVDLTDESCAKALVALRNAGTALALGNKRPLIEDMATWYALTEPRAGLPPARWEATVASSLPVVRVVRGLADVGDPPLSMTGALSGTLGVILAHVEAGGSAIGGLDAAVRAGLVEPDPRRDLAGVDTAAKALILARTAGWDIELEAIAREPLMGLDWNAVPIADVEGELARLGSALAASLSAGDNLRYLASVTSSGIRVGVCEAPTELAHLSPANSGLLIETRGFGAFPLLLSGRGGGSNAAAEAVLADVVAMAAGAGRD